MKQIMILKRTEDCEGCGASGFQMNEHQIVIPCPLCTGNHEKYANKYGSYLTDTLTMFVDVENGIIAKVTQKDEERGYLILKNKQVLQLNK